MFKKLLLIMVCTFGLMAAGHAKEVNQKQSFGVVNFASCVTESKLGKQEQASFEVMKTQMSKSLEELEKQISDLSTKFNDKEFLESLNPKAEEELRVKFSGLNEELARSQNQYYQLLNQANMRIIQMIQGNINQAAEKIANEKKIDVVFNKEALFYFAPSFDVTKEVIAEMDKQFEVQQNAAKKAAEESAKTATTEKVTK